MLEVEEGQTLLTQVPEVEAQVARLEQALQAALLLEPTKAAAVAVALVAEAREPQTPGLLEEQAATTPTVSEVVRQLQQLPTMDHLVQGTARVADQVLAPLAHPTTGGTGGTGRNGTRRTVLEELAEGVPHTRTEIRRREARVVCTVEVVAEEVAPVQDLTRSEETARRASSSLRTRHRPATRSPRSYRSFREDLEHGRK